MTTRGQGQGRPDGAAAGRRAARGATIRDVARHAGVSVQTVSRVLNDRPDVSPATRHLVSSSITALRYQPSAVARSLVSRRSQTIGAVVGGLQFLGPARTLSGTIEAATSAGLTVLVTELDLDDPRRFLEVVAPLLRHQVEGLVYCGPEVAGSAARLDEMARSLPVPLVHSHAAPAPDRYTVTIDEQGAVATAVAHLVAGGRRRIGHISGPPHWTASRDRRAGWLEGLHRGGLRGDGLEVEGDWTAHRGAAALTELLERVGDLDAVVAANDQTALGVLSRAHQLGIEVPDDLAVTGFDDAGDAEMYTPSLTTVRQPLAEAGRRAVQLLLHQMDPAEHPAPCTSLAASLVIRDSSAPPTRARG